MPEYGQRIEGGVLPNLYVWAAGLLWQAIKINLCPNTETQNVTDMDYMRHVMVACGMQV